MQMVFSTQNGTSMMNTDAFSIDANQIKKSIESVINGHQTLAQLNNIDEGTLVHTYQGALEEYHSGNMAEAMDSLYIPCYE